MKKFFLPIYIKLIFVTFLILLATVIPMMKRSLDIFEKTARRGSEEINLSFSMQKAEEVQTLIMGYIEKARTLGSLMLSDKSRKENFTELPDQAMALLTRESQMARQTIEDVLRLDKDLMAVELFEVKMGAPIFLARETKEDKWNSLKAESTIIDRMKKKQPLALNLILKGEVLLQSLTDENNREVQLLAVGAPVTSLGQQGVLQFVVCYINLNRLQKIFNSKGSRSSFVTDSFGNLVVHSYAPYTSEKKPFAEHPVVKKAMLDQNTKRQIKYLEPNTGEIYLSSFVKSSLGLIFISEVSEKSVLIPVKLVARQAIYTAGVMLGLMLLVIFLFSTSITIPIERLVSIAKQIAKGDFEINARASVKSLDEVGTLAQAFDEMVGGLKERDKVKTLFSKFHGSDIAEEMMAGEISVKGSNKDVTVFFSDVRGFTAFSEGRSPEEVVEMLNEYFQRMVHIINANHGVVDKFIGDAIMAVWGAPKSTGDDAYWCVKACLEMRQELADLNALRATRGQGPIMIGMGVHSGAAISGTIGSDERMEFTVIGDTVNQTSRIEASTKAFGTDLLLSDITAEKVKDRFLLDYAGSAEVKGKTEPLKFFKVKGYLSADGIVKLVETPYSEYKAEKADKVKVVA